MFHEGELKMVNELKVTLDEMKAAAEQLREEIEKAKAANNEKEKIFMEGALYGVEKMIRPLERQLEENERWALQRKKEYEGATMPPEIG